MRVRSLLVLASASALLAVSTIGCGGAPPPRPVAVAREPEPPPPVLAAEGVIQRAELDATIEAGLGYFLQKVLTEPDVRDGRFVGFRLVELRDDSLFAGLDLRPGDTLLTVNGQAIERPEQAFTVWSGLRVASELTIVVLRGEEQRELRFAIVDGPSEASETTQTTEQ
jgi:S1-C subfamily serine protease